MFYVASAGIVWRINKELRSCEELYHHIDDEDFDDYLMDWVSDCKEAEHYIFVNEATLYDLDECAFMDLEAFTRLTELEGDIIVNEEY